jgi:hypothetical protein
MRRTLLRRTLLVVGGGLAVAGALLPWVDLHVTGLPLSVHLGSAKEGVIGLLALMAGILALIAALISDGAPVSVLAAVGAAVVAAAGTWRVVQSDAYEVASATGVVHWSAGLGLWAMGLGAVCALASLFTASD